MPRPKCKRCNKIVHPTMMRAIAAALRSARTFGRPKRIYECPYGRGYHLTTKPGR